jgi:dsRNA-specific ribonuclease
MQLQVPHNTLFFLPTATNKSVQKKKKKGDRKEQLSQKEYEDGPYKPFAALVDFLGVSEPYTAGENVKRIANYLSTIATRLQNLVEHYVLLQKLETKIGISFKRKFYLHQATHQQGYEKGNKYSFNRRLHFLGDSIYDIVAMDWCLKQFPNASRADIRETYKYLTQNAILEKIDEEKKLNLIQYVPAEAKKDLNRSKAVPDILEGLIGALYLDTGDFSTLTSFCEKFLLSRTLLAKEFDLSKQSFSSTMKKYSITIPPVMKTFQEQLGIKFEKEELLLQALVDMNSNYLDWNQWSPTTKQSMHEKFALIGIVIVKYALGLYLWERYHRATPGELTESRKFMSSDDKFVHVYDALLSTNPFVDVKLNASMKAGLVHALLGAVYVDQGLAATTQITKMLFLEENPVHQLWEIVENLFDTNPTIETPKELRIVSDRLFTSIRANSLQLCVQFGSNIPETRNHAIGKTIKLCEMIKKENVPVSSLNATTLQELWTKSGGKGQILPEITVKRKLPPLNKDTKRKK